MYSEGVMKKPKSKFVCADCGTESPKWLGKCPGCGNWGSMSEELVVSSEMQEGALPSMLQKHATPVRLSQVETTEVTRFSTGSAEFDRALGGGVIPGEVFLVGGDPGIGKSTLLLQTAQLVAGAGFVVLYVTGEESIQQVRLRAQRLGAFHDALYVLAETDVDAILQHVLKLEPQFLIVDSIQTMFRSHVPSAPGSAQQVRESTMALLRLAKDRNVATCIVGHVTKDGTIAGPRLMEHMVDAVFYFEGDRNQRFRILRAVKNRFGSTNEIGVFDMQSGGLIDVLSPSEMFLAERSVGVAGSAVVSSLEGTRPMLIEVQALVTPTAFGTPRRMASGVDYNRVSLLMAVLEKRVGLPLQSQDAYVNVVGGVQMDEPAVDLGIAVSIASGFRDVPIKSGVVLIGEVGLTGEVRAVTHLEKRIQEAAKLGFTRVIAPSGNMKRLDRDSASDIEVIGVGSLQEALRLALGG